MSCWASGLGGNIGCTIQLQENPTVWSDQHQLSSVDLLKWSKIVPHNSDGSRKSVQLNPHMGQDKKEKKKAVKAKSLHYSARIQILTQLIMYPNKAGLAWPGTLFHTFVCTPLSFLKGSQEMEQFLSARWALGQVWWPNPVLTFSALGQNPQISGISFTILSWRWHCLA